MNKSILIVICDFIVLSVLSLSTGINPILTKNDQYAGNVLVNSSDMAKVLQGLAEREKKVEEMEKRLEINSLKLSDKEDALTKLTNNFSLLKDENTETKEKLAHSEEKNKDVNKILQQKIKENLLNEKRLAMAESQKAATELEIAKKRKLIAQINAKNRQIKEQLKKIVESKKNLTDELDKRNTVLATKTSELYRLNKELTVLEQTAKKQQAEINVKSKQLVTSKKQVVNLKQEVAKKDEDNKEFFKRLAYAQGKLVSTQLELKKAEEQTKKLNQNLTQQKVVLKKYQKSITEKHHQLIAKNQALATKEKQLKQTETQLDTTKSELSNVSSELKTKDKKLAKVTGKLQNKEQQLTKVTKQVGNLRDNLETTKSKLLRTGTILNKTMKNLQNNVLKSYADNSLRLSFEIKEKGLFSSSTTKKTLFCPEIGGVDFNYMLVDFNKVFAVPDGDEASYSKVSELKYCFNDANLPLKTKNWLKGVVLSLKQDPRVCLIALPKRVRGLNMINRKDLITRGLAKLYLFKAANYGQKSVILDGRCSLSLDKKDNYLYIRNNKKYPANGSLNAEIGDFILSDDYKAY